MIMNHCCKNKKHIMNVENTKTQWKRNQFLKMKFIFVNKIWKTFY